LILAVIAANADMEISHGLSFAREADPNGERTLAVLTKLDLMDRGTNATEMLTGKRIKVEQGIIGVVNRSQEDINNNKPIEECLKDEEIYLQTNYPYIASNHGVKYLENRLNEVRMFFIYYDGKFSAFIGAN
jgi:dynamin 1-like protein